MAATIGASGRLLCAPSPSTFLARHGLRLACTQPSGPGTPSSAASLQLALILAIYFMHAVGIAFYSRCLSAAALLASAAASAAVTSSAAEEAEMSLKAVAVVISSLLLRLHEKQQRELFMQVSQAKRLHILRLAADSRLSHLLKNRAASARFLCEKLALDW
jgi:flagellar biosynthesis protein FliP